MTELFERVEKLLQKETGTSKHSRPLSSEIRKVEKMLSHASLALQSVSMRLSTVSEMGDLVAIKPSQKVLNSIRSEMCSILPEASQELGNIGNLLSDICISTNQGDDAPVDTIMANADALPGSWRKPRRWLAAGPRRELPEVAAVVPSIKRNQLRSLESRVCFGV